METTRLDADASSTRRSRAWVLVLFAFFGLSSWITINGIYTELPLLLRTVPEGYKFPASMLIMLNLSNAGPLCLWFAFARVATWPGRQQAEEKLMVGGIYATLVAGVLGMLGLAFSWDVTVPWGGNEYSLPLLGFVFLAGLCDCSSSILYWRFVGRFAEVHVAALSLGESTNGLLASGFAAVQNVSGDVTFPASLYFVLLGIVTFLSLVSFHVLRTSPAGLAERASADSTPEQEECALRRGSKDDSPDPKHSEDGGATLSKPSRGTDLETPRTAAGLADFDCNQAALLLTQAWLNFLQNGVGISCLSLASRPYGSGVLQAAQTAQMVLDPVALLVGSRLRLRAKELVPVLALLTAGHLYIAALSLESVPPVRLGSGGGALLIAAAGVSRSLTAFSKMRVFMLMQAGSVQRAEARMLRAGAATQLGATVGSFLMFWLVNNTSLFRT